MRTFWTTLTLSIAITSTAFSQEVTDPKLKVIKPMITRIKYDAAKDGTRIGMSFMVQDLQGLPVNNLKAGRNGNFRAFIDGVQETSFETLTENSVTRPSVGITLVLDTSYSMEDQKALAPMKKAAEKFISRLESNKGAFRFAYYQFATTVKKIDDLDDINTKGAFGQFTSLYSALKTAIQDHPSNIILLFSDGADNKSPDNRALPVEGVEQIEELIQKNKTVIHTVKLGIEDSNDSKGVDNKEALKRLSINGSVRYETDPNALIKAFEDVASRLPYPYYFEYLCPRTRAGDYKIALQIDRNGVASNNSKWNPEASFELPFVLSGDDDRVLSLPGQATEKVMRPPFLWAAKIGQTFNHRPSVEFWSLMRFNGKSPAKLEAVSTEQVSSIFVSLRNVSIDPTSNTISYEVAFDGPAALMKSIHEEQFRKLKPWPTTYVYQHDVFTEGHQHWNEIARVSLAPGTLLFINELDPREPRGILVSPRITSQLKLNPAAATWITVAGEYLGTDGKEWFLSVRQDSVFQIR